MVWGSARAVRGRAVGLTGPALTRSRLGQRDETRQRREHQLDGAEQSRARERESESGQSGGEEMMGEKVQQSADDRQARTQRYKLG